MEDGCIELVSIIRIICTKSTAMRLTFTGHGHGLRVWNTIVITIQFKWFNSDRSYDFLLAMKYNFQLKFLRLGVFKDNMNWIWRNATNTLFSSKY